MEKEPEPGRERSTPGRFDPAGGICRHLLPLSLNHGSCLCLVVCLMREDCFRMALGWLSVAADDGMLVWCTSYVYRNHQCGTLNFYRRCANAGCSSSETMSLSRS